MQLSQSTREVESGHSHSAEQSSTTATASGGGDTLKEKASLLTTTARSSSKHRRNKANASEAARSRSEDEQGSSAAGGPRANKGRRANGKKISLWKRLVYALTCQSPHAIEIDEGVSRPPEPSTSDAGKEQPISEKPTETAAPGTAAPREIVVSIPQTAPGDFHTAPSTAEVKTDTPGAGGEAAPVVTPAPDLAPSESEDPSVVVPPSPTTHVLPVDETLNVTSGAVVPPGATGREQGEESEESSIEEDDHRADEEDEEERLILQGGAGIPKGPDGVPRPLLPPLSPQHAGRKCLVLDLDETLVHSSFKVPANSSTSLA